MGTDEDVTPNPDGKLSWHQNSQNAKWKNVFGSKQLT